MEVSYTALNEELVRRITTQRINEKDKNLIKMIVEDGYSYYKKWSRMTILSTTLLLIFFVGSFVFLIKDAKGGWMIYANVCMILCCILFVIVIFSVLMVNRAMHIKEAIKLMKTYYPDIYNSYNFI